MTYAEKEEEDKRQIHKRLGDYKEKLTKGSDLRIRQINEIQERQAKKADYVDKVYKDHQENYLKSIETAGRYALPSRLRESSLEEQPLPPEVLKDMREKMGKNL